MSRYFKFDRTVVNAIVAAKNEAKQMGMAVVGRDHLLLGLLTDASSDVAQTMRKYGLDTLPEIEEDDCKPCYDGTPKFSKEASAAIMLACKTASGSTFVDNMGRVEVSVTAQDLLRSLMHINPPFVSPFNSLLQSPLHVVQ